MVSGTLPRSIGVEGPAQSRTNCGGSPRTMERRTTVRVTRGTARNRHSCHGQPSHIARPITRVTASLKCRVRAPDNALRNHRLRTRPTPQIGPSRVPRNHSSSRTSVGSE